MKQTECLVHAEIDGNVLRVTTHAILESGEGLLRIVLDVQICEPGTRAQNRQIRSILLRLRPFRECSVGEATREIEGAKQVVRGGIFRIDFHRRAQNSVLSGSIWKNVSGGE